MFSFVLYVGFVSSKKRSLGYCLVFFCVMAPLKPPLNFRFKALFGFKFLTSLIGEVYALESSFPKTLHAWSIDLNVLSSNNLDIIYTNSIDL